MDDCRKIFYKETIDNHARIYYIVTRNRQDTKQRG
jgi:hypothetical protein